ncbi:HupE/UreJ family protein [Bradyrhizobium sp.]|uniref:HupE/UreJ family protein n=1 Tax=Bradyrhizobium sp. TaxID=376 RepID=UPI0035257187
MSLRRLLRSIVGLCVLLGAAAATADEFRPGYLELRQQDAETWEVFWKLPAQGGQPRPGGEVVFPADTVILSEPRGAMHAGAYAERWRLKRSGGLIGQTVRIDGLPPDVTDVLVRVQRSDGTTQVTRLLPSEPAFVVTASAGSGEVARTYLVLGVEHILLGIDHLLFVLALLLIVKGAGRVVVTVTAFTIAHSITLAAATLGLVRVPGPPVEAVIALSIVFVAAEIVHGANGRPGLTARWPWLVAFTFGLLHGFGFAGVLGEIGLPQNAIPLALFFFNVGVELGQLLFIAAFAVAARLVARVRTLWPRWIELTPAYAIGSIAMFWVLQRVVALGDS